MNKFKFISAVFIAAVMLSACEKEDVNTPSNSDLTNSKDTKYHTNKNSIQ